MVHGMRNYTNRLRGNTRVRSKHTARLHSRVGEVLKRDRVDMHDWFYYTSTKCAIPDDMGGNR
jgi:hypothetical protein